MTRMLVVPSPTLNPLSTEQPAPTDGLPGWWACQACGHTRRDGDEPCPECASRSSSWAGPLPATVAVWQEVWHCGRCKLPKDDPDGCCCGYVTSYPAGAVVATVEITGPSHHADECHAAGYTPQFCHPDALPDCWHTPTGQVTRLEVPIPCEQPWVMVDVCGCNCAAIDLGVGIQHEPGCGTEEAPASFWVADANDRYELVACDVDDGCSGRCRGWLDVTGEEDRSTPTGKVHRWLMVEAQEAQP